jgi:hypothetical protein
MQDALLKLVDLQRARAPGLLDMDVVHAPSDRDERLRKQAIAEVQTALTRKAPWHP